MLLTYGSKGTDVTNLQTKLNESGYGLDVDGVYGAKTQAAVRDYQSKNGLSTDGIAGDQTFGSLNSSGTSSASSTTPTDTATAAEPDYGKYKYDTSTDEAYQKALAELDTVKATTPDYQATYDKQINDIYEKIMNRDKFSYDLNSDMLYQQYKNQYQTLGQQAMQDTMGQASALTGGYDSTYAQSAGQQQYDAYLQSLNEVVPELYQNALSQYNQEGTDLQTQYGLAADQRDTEYNQYQNSLSDYYTRLQNAQNTADTSYERGSNDYWNSLNTVKQDESTAYTRKNDAYDKLVTLISTLGYSPTTDELSAAGMSAGEAQKWLSYYAAQTAASGSSGSGGGSSGRSSSGGSGSSSGSSGSSGSSSSNLSSFQQMQVDKGKATADTANTRFSDTNTLFSSAALKGFNQQIGMMRTDEGKQAIVADAYDEGKISDAQYVAYCKKYGWSY